jgi:hypothetical protein
MSNCCAAESACGVSNSGGEFCPMCGSTGKTVSTLTVKSLVRGHSRVAVRDVTYRFCRTPDCDVVYYFGDIVFLKPDLKVRVGIKEQDDSVPLCYCFGYTRADVRRDLEENGSPTIPDKVKTEIESGFCACEVKNPSGACCLGELNRSVRKLITESPLAE